MERERPRERLWHVRASGKRIVLSQIVAVTWIRAAFNDEFHALVWIFASQVGDAVFRDNHLHRMLAVIHVSDEWDDRADLAASRQ